MAVGLTSALVLTCCTLDNNKQYCRGVDNHGMPLLEELFIRRPERCQSHVQAFIRTVVAFICGFTSKQQITCI